MARLSLLGVEVDPSDLADLNQRIAEAIAQEKQCVIANHNVHSVYLYHRDPKMRAFFDRAEVVHFDGMPLVYWARVLGHPVTKRDRVTYVDWVHPLMATAASEGWRVFYLGGKPGVAARAAERLRRQYPALVLETRHGYFTPEENDAVLEEIAFFGPHVLMVGMGMPRQEHWVLDNLERISANAILTAGACFDYVAGVVPTPPRWMGRMGLEWLYRLCSEPRRLYRRYLLEPWFLVPIAWRDLVAKFNKVGGHERFLLHL
jgi:N-acetylglucosaminyldiphosphoundecaprenol N-acetyl-beta-D-mannosaminyltransferase